MGKGKDFTASFLTQEDDFRGKDFEAPLIGVLEKNIRFSLKCCDTGRKHCITNVAKDKKVLTDLYNRLGYFENITWSAVRKLAHEQGISIEKRDSSNYKDLASNYKDFDTFGHFRVNTKNKSKFRVFGAISDDLFYILRFDVDGKANHN